MQVFKVKSILGYKEKQRFVIHEQLNEMLLVTRSFLSFK